MPELHHGNALDVLRTLPAESAHCVATSPPYWAVRDYGLPAVAWPAMRFAPVAGLPEIEIPEQDAVLGLEKDPWAFVGHIVAVFREVRRVLRSDGTLWLNFGEKYGTGALKSIGLKPGDRVGMPWRVALALQADGWYLRQENIWAKSSPMPESLNGWRWERCKQKTHCAEKTCDHGYRSWTVFSGKPGCRRRAGNNAEWKDCPGCPKCETSPIQGFILRRPAWRPTTAHEQIFLLSKSKTYYADREAVATEAKAVSKARAKRGAGDGHKLVAGAPGQIAHSIHAPRENKQDGVGKSNYTGFNARYRPPATANLRSVWRIKRTPFPGRHFATFPPGLPERCILSGTSQEGVCPECGAPWVRVMESGDYQRKTLFWAPSCDCGEPMPARAVVLDPFAGSGTTLRVAESLGRRGIGIELNPDYIAMALEPLAAAEAE